MDICHVHIVSTDKTIIAPIYTALIDMGHRLSKTSTIENGAMALIRHTPDLILLDSGSSICIKEFANLVSRRPARIGKTLIVPIINVPSQNDLDSLYSLNYHRFLLKPIHKSNFAHFLRDFMRERSFLEIIEANEKETTDAYEMIAKKDEQIRTIITEKDEQIRTMRKKLSKLNSDFTTLKGSMHIDSVSGAFNRDLAIQTLTRLLQELELNDKKILVITYIDIDKFSYFNAQNGAYISDEALKRFHVLIKKNVTDEDIISRWESDKFLIISEDIAVADCVKAAGNISLKVETTHFGSNLSLSCTTIVCSVITKHQDISTIISALKEKTKEMKKFYKKRPVIMSL